MGQGDAPERIRRALAAAFDPVFYRTVYDDIARTGADPFRHYAETGWREGRDPAPWFSAPAYLETRPDVSGSDPFAHYLDRGWREGAEPAPSRHRERFLERSGGPVRTAGAASPDAAETPAVAAADPDLPEGLTREAARDLVAAAFDRAHYLSAYPDVAAAGVDPLDHYLRTGRREGRDPRADFNAADYLEVNPDVAASGVDPFLHWLVAGRAEGRPLRFELGFRGRIVAGLTPLSERQEAAARAAADLPAGPARGLSPLSAPGRGGGLHITFSHDDYTARVGGVQLCLQTEAAGLAGRGIDHLHLFPVAPWPTLRPAGSQAAVGVVWNGRTLGGFAAADIRRAVKARAARAPGGVSFAIHSLLGHEIGETLDLLAAAGARRGLFWLHDFAGLCAGYHLMRDEARDCGAPPAGSAACRICVFGPGRDLHLSAHRRLFEALDLTLVAPSQAALDTWNAAPDAPQARRQVVHPHARLAPTGRQAGGDPDAPLKVAFLGMPSAYKGWPVFTDLAHRFGGDPRYRFVRLGSAAAPGPADHIEVSVTADNPHAMRQALETAGVDVAVLWSLCRETFSFAAYEAAAAGAAILTGPDSGNIAAFTRAGGHGLVLPDEAALEAQFASSAVLHLSRDSRRPDLCDIAYSGMSVDLLEALS
ncbi:MAG: hypothetical protein RL588_1471 [Pseudomonadota bacterium]